MPSHQFPAASRPPALTGLPITVAHDYFTQLGGAERVAATLVERLRPQRVVTAVWEPSQTFELADSAPETSFLQRFEWARRDPRPALPLLPMAWRLIRPVSEGVVISSSTGWSHGVRTTGRARKVVYCHNPARWLYQADDYLRGAGPAPRAVLRLLRPMLLRWDQRAAQSVDRYIANSTAVAARIKEVYGRRATVVHPPVSIDPTAPQSEVALPFGDFFLTVGRGRGYKNLDVLLEAFWNMPDKNLVIVGPRPREGWPPNVTFTGRVTDAQLRWLYSSATALISVSHEDFGLTPLEANTFGTPALVLRAGGFLDSLLEGVSGRFIEAETPEAVVRAVQSFPAEWDASVVRAHAAKFSVDAFIERITAVLLELASEDDSTPFSAATETAPAA